jgi:hypothetical protein
LNLFEGSTLMLRFKNAVEDIFQKVNVGLV